MCLHFIGDVFISHLAEETARKKKADTEKQEKQSHIMRTSPGGVDRRAECHADHFFCRAAQMAKCGDPL